MWLILHANVLFSSFCQNSKSVVSTHVLVVFVEWIAALRRDRQRRSQRSSRISWRAMRGQPRGASRMELCANFPNAAGPLCYAGWRIVERFGFAPG
jgi:hypothetical protein